MPSNITRRDVLRLAAATGVAVAVGGSLQVAAAQTADKKIIMGFIGVGGRGTVLLRELLKQSPDVQIPAVCDIDEKNLNRALDLIEKSSGRRPEGYSKGPEDYRRLLTRDDINSCLIATPQELHAVMVIDSLKAGKFVGSEVPACCTIEECWELVHVQQQTKTGYMMLENYVYPSFLMHVQQMVDAGLFGDLTYAAGNYIHEIRRMRFNPDGSLTWRGQNILNNIGVIYPTHAIGPVCRWMGINRDDKLSTLVAMASRPAATHEYAVRKFGPDSAAAKINFQNGDTNHALIRTAKGRLIEIRYDTASPRPNGMGQYSLQGTKGAFESVLGQRVIYFDSSAEAVADEAGETAEKWQPLEKYSKYQHPRWLEHGKDAASAGHGGADYFLIQDFLAAIRSGVSPIDVYDAVTWSCIRPLSALSIQRGSQPVEIPDFKATPPA